MTSILRLPLTRHAAPASRCLRWGCSAQPSALRVAALHSTSKRLALLPQGPRENSTMLNFRFLEYNSESHANSMVEVIQGGVNDPAPVPEPNSAHGSYHWTLERILAAGLIPLTMAPFAAGSLNPTMDAILCSTILLHSHMGFQQVVIDYIPKRAYPRLRRFAGYALNLATLTVGVGLYEFETNDIGVTEAIKRVWKA